MADQKNGISYCDETWNVAAGCSPVSPGCRSCWAKGMVHRMQTGVTTGPRNGALCPTVEWNGRVELRPDWLSKPLHWRRPRVVLVQTLGDLFHDGVPFEYVAAVYGVMAACPHLTFLVLTKRPERMLEFYRWVGAARGTNTTTGELVSMATNPLMGCKIQASRHGVLFKPREATKSVGWPLPNVFTGISSESQPELEARWSVLRQVPAARYWLSAEPLLGPITIPRKSRTIHFCSDVAGMLREQTLLAQGLTGCMGHENPGLSFVACGPETGPRARPCDVEWIRSVVRQCQDAGVRVHVKAVPVRGKPSKNPLEWAEDLRVREEVPM